MDEDNITFETMPDKFSLDWGMMKGSNNIPIEKTVESEHIKIEEEKVYDSLYKELIDKCNPKKFPIESAGREKFRIANKIYAQLQNGGVDIPETVLISLRNQAIDELGVKISTKKKFEFLKSILNPEQYLEKKPYDEKLVDIAAVLYDELLSKKGNIRELEMLENNPDLKYIEDEYDYRNLEIDKYLEKHQNGKYAEMLRKSLFEKEELDYKLFTAEKYLEKYPNGRFVIEAKERIEQELEEAKRQRAEELVRIRQNKENEVFLQESARNYLKKYPDGRFSQEARCFRKNKFKYLKEYPNGRYKQVILEVVLSVTFFCVFVLLIFISVHWSI